MRYIHEGKQILVTNFQNNNNHKFWKTLIMQLNITLMRYLNNFIYPTNKR